MIPALTLSAAVGIMLGLTSRVSSLIVVLITMTAGGLASAVWFDYPLPQALAVLVMVQVGYLGASYVRVRMTLRGAPKAGVGAADSPPVGLGPPDLH